MPKTVVIALGNQSSALANQCLRFMATVTNSDAAAVTLKSLTISEESKLGAVIEQPNFLTAGQPWDTSQPVIGPAAAPAYPFSVMVPSPNTPGVSATNPGGANPGQPANPSANSQLILRATGQTSDGSVFSSTFTVPVLSAVSPFPVSDVGSAQFRQGGNSNLFAAL